MTIGHNHWNGHHIHNVPSSILKRFVKRHDFHQIVTNCGKIIFLSLPNKCFPERQGAMKHLSLNFRAACPSQATCPYYFSRRLKMSPNEGVVEQKYFTFPLSVSFVIFLYISIRQINVLSYESKCHAMKALEEWPLKEPYFSLYEFYCRSSIIMVTKGARMVILIEYCPQYPCFSQPFTFSISDALKSTLSLHSCVYVVQHEFLTLLCLTFQ